MKMKIAILAVALLCLTGLTSTTKAISLTIEIGDRPYYTHGPGYWYRHHYYVWVPGHWAWRHHHHVWIHGHYRLR